MGSRSHRFTRAALLIMGGGLCLWSCDKQSAKTVTDYETVITQKSDSLRIIASENGKRQYVFTAPLMEEYGMSKEPFMEFRKGIEIETFNDSTGVRESSLVADYAIFLENQKLWQAKGNVVAVNNEGQKLETQQLFWNQNTKRIYSNVDTRVSRPNGERITGMGFESDEAMKDWVFRRPTGTILVNVDPTDGDNPDTTATARPPRTPSAPPPSRTVLPAPHQTQGPPPAPSATPLPQAPPRPPKEFSAAPHAMLSPAQHQVPRMLKPHGTPAATNAAPAPEPLAAPGIQPSGHN